MPRRSGRLVPVVLATALATGGLALTASAAHAANGGALLYGLTSANHLVSFRETAPGTALTDVAITGLAASENVVGIDVRPADGSVLALGSTGQLYTVNPTSGAATAIGTTPVTLNGTSFDIDINPTVDRLRVVSDADQNLRLNPSTGALAATDTSLAYSGGTPDPNVTAVAYTNSVNAAGSTTLYGIDTGTDSLVTLASPNTGVLTTVGALGVDTSGVAGLDIDAASGKAFALLTVGGTPGLYTIDLASGTATLVGAGVAGLTDVTAPVVPRKGYVLLTDNTLATLDVTNPGTLGTPVAITGTSGDVVGIDVRPATGALYAVTVDSLFTVDPATGAATLVSALSSPLSGSAFGVDFNPVADRLRIVSDTGQNVRVNPDTAAVTTDVALNPGTPAVVGAGYLNSFAGATATTLYDLDATTDTLYVQTPPNNGTLVAVGTGLGVDITAASDLDIAADGNAAYAALTVGGVPSLYRINLTTGVASLLKAFSSTLVEDLALANPGRLTAANVVTDEGQSTATVTVTRSGGSAGTESVDYATSDGSATAGSDYTATSGRLTFADGETTKTFAITLLSDTLAEGAETIAVVFDKELGGTATVAAITVTIADNDNGVAYGLTDDGSVVTLDPANPAATPSDTELILGLEPNEDVLGIDVRPSKGVLYAFTSSGRILTVDPTTGDTEYVATSTTLPSGAAFGVDFNPVADRLRVVSDAGQNLRINPDTGAATVDTALTYAAGDTNTGQPAVTAAGYTSSAAGATSTALYDLDTTKDVLVLQTPPNNGTLTTVGALGVDATSLAGFDISSPGDSAFAVLRTSGGAPSQYRINLSTGAAYLQAAYAVTNLVDLAVATPVAALAGRFHALAPTRLIDTRQSTPVAAGTDRTITVAGLAGVPSTGVSSVALNVTSTRGTKRSYVSVYPTGPVPSPITSNLNFFAKQTIAVQVQTGLGTGGAVNVRVGAGQADIVIDVLGWYGDSTDTAGKGYRALTPTRLLDTRTTSKLVAGTPKSQQVGGQVGVPSGATAVAVNVTVTGLSSPTFVQLYPGASGTPATSSTINAVPGQTIANASIVQLGPDGSIGIKAGAGSLNVIIDVVGYYGATGTGRFTPVTPSRLLDTRSTGPRLAAGTDRDVVVAGAGGVPVGAAAAALSVTGSNASTALFVQTYPTGNLPSTPSSTINLVPNTDIANLAVTPLGTGGAASFKAGQGSTELIVDVTGWFSTS